MIRKLLTIIQPIIKKWFISVSQLKYPDYINQCLSQKDKMELLIKKCYESEFEFIDLEKLHKEIFEKFPEYLNLVNNLKTKHIPREEFEEIGKPDFWIVEYQNLLYLLNGETMIPINSVIDNVHVGWTISLMFIPNDNKIICSNRLLVDDWFIKSNILQNISNIDVLRRFFKNCDFVNSNSQINQFCFSVWDSKLSTSDKINLLYERDELPFLFLILMIYQDRLEFNLEKVIYSLFNYEEKRFLEFTKISETSQLIFSESLVIELLKKIIISKETFLNLFKVEMILGYLKMNNIKNIKSIIKVFTNNYLYYSSLDDKIRNDFIRFKKSYYREIKKIIRELENQIRLEKGYNLVGTFTNETILFQNLKSYFKDYSVVSQGSPIWLGLQRIDIYFPEFNIGVEYHGEQHFVPVDYFGGEEGLKKNIERDKRKMELCIKNGCKLFVVDKNYEFLNLCNQIEKEIKIRI